MISGIYKCTVKKEYANADDIIMGEIILIVKNSEKSFLLNLVKNTVKYDAPQIDDLFYDTGTVRINKRHSIHAIKDWGDNTFTLYPYRVGVPYLFELVKGR